MSLEQPSYDPNVAQDHTGLTFNHVPGRERRDPLGLFRKPMILDCGCGGETWRVFADADPRSGLIAFQCRDCKKWSRPIEAHQPQMDDDRARKLGLVVPNMRVRTDLDIEQDMRT